MENLMEPFFKYFKEISLVPRKPGNENLIADYLIKFAIDNKLKYYSDELYNVIIYKEATKGYENKEVLGLQSHTDMICEKVDGLDHNFLKDPLNIYIDGDYIKAKGTTLGADNGVGVSYMLAILSSKDILTPKLECIFTTQEETTMNGARKIDESKISAKKIISFDNFSEEEMWISSSNCKEWNMLIENEYITIDNYNTYELSLQGFKGGHSGLDIDDITRVNPIKLAIEIINNISCELYINKINGGSRVNIIPRDCNIQFSTKENITEGNIKYLEDKYEGTSVYIKKVLNNKKIIKNTKEIIQTINKFNNGVINKDKDGNVVLSSNLGVIETNLNECIIGYSIRINDKKLGEDFVPKIYNIFKENKFKIKDYDEMIGYESKEDSKLVKYCSDEYYKVFNKNIKKVKVQACLECGFFASKIDNLEYISIAPNIYNAHSPSECFSISSAKRMWYYIQEFLNNWEF
jgi:dipeptidase D